MGYYGDGGFQCPKKLETMANNGKWGISMSTMEIEMKCNGNGVPFIATDCNGQCALQNSA
jgi:hypothetical protein